jgi:hypothetical protein
MKAGSGSKESEAVKTWTPYNQETSTHANAPASSLPPVTLESLQKTMGDIDAKYPELATQRANMFPVMMRPIAISRVCDPWDFFLPRYRLTGHRSVVHRLAKKLLEGLPEGTKIDLAYNDFTPKHTALFTIDGNPKGILVCKPTYPIPLPLPAHRGARAYKQRRRRQ